VSDTLEHPFDPIIFSDTKMLFLGSFPSIQSFEKGFYYANPRNQFWQILSRITGYPVLNRDQRIWLLKAQRWGLWDMVRSCSRDNSLDSSLYDEEVNDISELLERAPSITKIAFTGRKAEALYKLHFDHLDMETLYLPSPSAAYAKMSLEAKAAAWRDKLLGQGSR
jgi:hypoxanthine-DNA glycosylase